MSKKTIAVVIGAGVALVAAGAAGGREVAPIRSVRVEVSASPYPSPVVSVSPSPYMVVVPSPVVVVETEFVEVTPRPTFSYFDIRGHCRELVYKLMPDDSLGWSGSDYNQSAREWRARAEPICRRFHEDVAPPA